MEIRLSPTIRAILIGSLLLLPAYGEAENNQSDQYSDFLEPEDNIIITGKNETITYSPNTLGVSGISAKHTVKTSYMNRGYGDEYRFQINYDEENSKITNIKEDRVTHSFSSNFGNDGIFFDGLNSCNCVTNLNKTGEIAYFEYERDYKDAIYLAKVVFAEPIFIKKHTIKIEIPSWLDMEIKEFNFDDKVKKTVEQEKDKTIYTYTMENVKPIKEEKFSQPFLYAFPSILFAYKHATLPEKGEVKLFATTTDQYQWYNMLLAQAQEKNDNLCSETKKIVAGCKDDYEKVATLYQWVQKNIRYIAFENGLAGFKPQPASMVMDNKYGDCKGMANLLRNMLKCEGIDGRMVWLGTKDLPYDYSTPSIAVDNHAICAAILPPDTIYLDATWEYAAMKEYPSSIAGRPVLLEDGYKGKLSRIPDVQPHDNLDSIHVALKITEKGLEGSFKNILRGEDKILFLTYFDDDYSDIIESLHKKRFKGLPAENDQVKITGIQPSNQETIVEYPFSTMESFTKTDKKYYVSMDIKCTFIFLDTEKRKTDLVFPYKAVDSYSCELEIPTGYKITHLPQNLLIDKEKYKFEIKYNQKGNKLYYSRAITLKDPTIQEKELNEWNKDLAQLKSAYMEMVALGK
ncbi:MAG: DUF3858 domain-containing protein [Paludibacteraceae bacterium]|nr:DUF3858 domain-containing protein [Paludibacteraceae bacterium]